MNNINILVATNNNYLLPTMTMLYSLMVHTKEKIVVYVLHSELTENEKNKIDALLLKAGHSKAEYIRISEKEFEGYHTEKWISKETYYRLLAQKLLPESVERILWLDGDTIVRGDLSDFYHMDLKGKLIAACDLGFLNESNRADVLKRLFLPSDAKPFNAGVILYDMEEIQKHIDPDIYMQYVQYLGKHLFFADQDVLNAVFYNQVYYVDPHVYNWIRIFEPIEMTGKRVDFRAVKILHYNGSSKPWNADYCGLYSHVFWRYAKHIEGWELCYEDVKESQRKSRRKRLNILRKKEQERKEKPND
ncbi:MAG: glycosyltransferase family 8 protein [Lachnospiraceae bacterium]|nr:glycosyltransferase family 8 protein [Lachnospiraceae bacterium]